MFCDFCCCCSVFILPQFNYIYVETGTDYDALLSNGTEAGDRTPSPLLAVTPPAYCPPTVHTAQLYHQLQVGNARGLSHPSAQL